MKRIIRKNIYGNWVGYIGRNREIEFGEDGERAQFWLETGSDQGTRNHEGMVGLKFRFGG